jgi:isopentenyl-diphosphate delta-isomerase
VIIMQSIDPLASSAAAAIDPSQPIAQATQNRKADHLRACLEDDVQCRQVSSGFDRYAFEHRCLPELDRTAIDPSTQFLGKALRAPFLISSMTGGTEQAERINFRLAAAAQRWGFAMGVGSQRVAVERPEVRRTFAVRSVAPDILLLANLGAVQLNHRYGLQQCQDLVDWLEADALILHLNPLQEAVQTKGDTNFAGLLDRIADLCDRLPVPVIAKEVGNGISGTMAQQLLAAGVRAIDVAGAGGTSWAKVESVRARDPKQRRLGETFRDWGLPTVDCLLAVRQVAPRVPLIASGGLRNGLDAAKAIALGADLVGLAMPFLHAAEESPDALDFLCDILVAELETAMFCTGNRTIADLQTSGRLQQRP